MKLVTSAYVAALGLLVTAEAGSSEFYDSTTVFTPPDELPVIDVPLSRSLSLKPEQAQELFTTVVATPDGRLERLAPSRRQIGELMSLLRAERWASGSGRAPARTKVERGRVPGDDRRSAWREIDLLEEGMMTPETVIGDDTRELIADTTNTRSGPSAGSAWAMRAAPAP
jgi:hypothetical protein